MREIFSCKQAPEDKDDERGSEILFYVLPLHRKNACSAFSLSLVLSPSLSLYISEMAQRFASEYIVLSLFGESYAFIGRER